MAKAAAIKVACHKDIKSNISSRTDYENHQKTIDKEYFCPLF